MSLNSYCIMETIQINGADRDLYVVEHNHSDISLTTNVLHNSRKGSKQLASVTERLWTTPASDRKALNSSRL